MIVTNFNTTLIPKTRSHSLYRYLSVSRSISFYLFSSRSISLLRSLSLLSSFSLLHSFPLSLALFLAHSRSFISAVIHFVLMQLNERDSMHTNRYRHMHSARTHTVQGFIFANRQFYPVNLAMDFHFKCRKCNLARIL